jgi:hypothetical protein
MPTEALSADLEPTFAALTADSFSELSMTSELTVEPVFARADASWSHMSPFWAAAGFASLNAAAMPAYAGPASAAQAGEEHGAVCQGAVCWWVRGSCAAILPTWQPAHQPGKLLNLGKFSLSSLPADSSALRLAGGAQRA